ncbi:MAG: MMPL family transporter, partial [Planctomycetes bacterium]|nr:MMPL family transporter [Planctomycetota bacterium]
MAENSQPQLGRRQRALVALARFVCRRALWIVLAALVLAGASVAYTLARIEFLTDRNALVGPDAEYNKRFMRYQQAFGDQELMLLMVAPAPGPVDNPDYAPPVPGPRTRAQMKAAAAEVAKKLRSRPDLFPQVVERVDPNGFGGTRMLYLPLPDVQSIEAQVQAGEPVLRELAANPSYPGLLSGLRRGIEEGRAPAQADPAALRQAGDGMATLLRALRENLAAAPGEAPPQGLFTFESSDPTLDNEGYFFSWGGRLLFVPVLPARDQGALDQVAEPLAFARQAVAEAGARYPELAIGLSGRPVIYSDEMASSSRDMTWATLISLVGVAVLFVAAFRSVSRPLLAVVSLVLALCWTFGATTLVIGHLNIFAMVFAVVLVGLGIDFGIHLLAHYCHGLRRGFSVQEALVQVYAELGMGTVLGAATTAAALATAMLTDFLGLAELGAICGMGIMLCLLAMLLVFPALLVLLDARRVGEGSRIARQAGRDEELRELEQPRHIGAGRLTRTLGLLVALLALAGAGYAGLRATQGWVPFEYNLLELNDPSSAAVHWERMLVQHDQRASYVVCTRGSLQELHELRRRLEPLREQGLVRAFECLAPEQETEKREVLHKLHGLLPGHFAEPTTANAVEVRAAARKLQAALAQLATRGDDVAAAFAPATEELRRLQELIKDQPGHVEQRMGETGPAFFGALRTQLLQLRADSNPPPVTAATLPDLLKPRYLGKGPTGEEVHALYVYPARNVWEHELAGEFNRAVLAVDPEATGVTIQIHESANLIVAGFLRSVLYAFLMIAALLALDLRRPLALATAMLPLLGSLAMLLGVMAVSGLDFNFANFFAVPILVGTTVDAGVYMVHAQRHGDPVLSLRHARKACLLCALTTLLGFGALSFAHHKGIVSLGLLLSVGTLGGLA